MKKLMTKERLFAFSDAILAIIMTILVLELPKPDKITWESIRALLPFFLTFAASFFNLASFWMDWHREWHDVQKISDKTVWCMLFVLFFMAFIPYNTGLLASDMINPVGQILYGLCGMLINLFNSLCYRSIAAVADNSDIREILISRANLLFINTAIMLVGVILSLTVFTRGAIIAVVITSITFVLPIFKK